MATLEKTDQLENADRGRIIHLIQQVGPEFALRLANYARNELYLIHAAIALLAEVSLLEQAGTPGYRGKSMLRKYVPLIVSEPEELAGVLVYLRENHGTIKLRASLKTGMADAFANLSAEQLLACRNTVLKEVVRLVHPRPWNDERAKLYKQILTEKVSSGQRPAHEPVNEWTVSLEMLEEIEDGY